MINNIKYLKNFGIFQDYSQKEINEFNRFNLIYGWNGSGKTTLVALFELLKNKQLPDRFASADFSITVADKKITHKNLNDSNINLHIFNNSFIKENINWDSAVKSILLIAEEQIAERKQLESLKKIPPEDIKNKQTTQDLIKSSKKDMNLFMTQTAKSIKQGLQAIDTSDRYFMNYDKRKLETFMTNKKEEIQNKSGLLNEKKVTQCIEGAKPNKKDKISLDLSLCNLEGIKSKEAEITGLLNKSITNSAIERLISNSDIQSWVETGLKIHKKYHFDKCEFCNNTLSPERIKQLEGHFNQEFEDFKQELDKALESIKEYFIQLDDKFPSNEKFYTEYVEQFKAKSKELTATSREINSCLKKWTKIIQKKINNPFNTSLQMDSIDESLIVKIKNNIQGINNLIEKHNQKTDDFEQETKEKKTALELHYTTEKIKDFNYYSKQDDLKNQEKQLKALEEKINKRQREINTLESVLSNEGIGAKKINSALHKFLGRDDLSLQFNQDKKGYDIIRKSATEQHSQYLSEGEKRAIAFVYFIIKLQEKRNPIEESVVIIDDPMSSLDSNNLFQAYSFLRSHCEKAKQLFVFTHNFTYFKLVRDWLNKKNENRKRDKTSKLPIANFFIVDATLSSPRSAELNKLPESLLKYNSEYHYMFKTLFQYKDKATLDINQAFLTANLSRRLLETFFYFKYPKYRLGLSNLLDEGVKHCIKTTSETKDKIYNFINKYSHSDKIEVNEDTAENIMGESYPVINDIFKWIEEVDQKHYDEMVEVVNSTK